MGDNDFQEFLHCVQDPPQHFQAPAYSYTLVHSITPFEENKSFLEKVELGEKLCGIKEDDSFILDRGWDELRGDDNDRLGWQDSPTWDLFRSPREKDRDDDSDTDNKTIKNQSGESRHSEEEEEEEEEDDEDQDACSPFPSLLPRAESDLAEVITAADRERILETGRTMMETSMTSLPSPEECRRSTRRRRRLPEIPKDKRPLEGLRQQQQQSSLFEELSASTPSWAIDQRVAFPPSPGGGAGPSNAGDDPGQSRLPGHPSSFPGPVSSGPSSSILSSRTKDVLTSIVDKFDHPGLPPALILNLVNLESLEEGTGDVDSGNSTSHSPEDSFRNFYKKDKTEQDTLSPISPSLGGGQRMELLDPTHRGLHR